MRLLLGKGKMFGQVTSCREFIMIILKCFGIRPLMPGRPVAEAPPVNPAQMIAGAAIGNALEFYDFIIYGFFATSIAAAFFPGRDPTAKLLLTFGTFGVSFFARPIGALILGAYADRKGRTACMILCVLLMTLAAAMIALMPSYASIGLAAPLGILVSRLIQGFALGGEFGSATALMIEHSAGAETRAASWQGTSQNFAGLFASGVAWLLSHDAAAPLFHLPAFRVAFGVGVLGGPIALFLRRRLLEAPAFLAQQQLPKPEVVESTLSGIVIAAGMVAIGTAQTYLVIYLPTYATTQLHMTAGSALGSVFLLYVVTLAITPVRLMIASRFDASHRATAMLVSCLAMLAAGYPAFMLLGLWPGPVMLFLLPLGFTLLGLFYNAPLAGFMGLVFAVRQRGVGLSIGYALGIALFGGSAPFINTWLVAKTGDPRSPGLYLIFAAIVSIVAVLAAQRRVPRKLL
jgi:MHS family proline/betaine transporter-like MFS transporter